MGYPNSRFNPLDKELSDFAKVLALPGRISIMRILLEQEDWITAESTAFTEIPLSCSTLDYNLYCLRKANILQMKLSCGLRHYKFK